MSRRPVTAGRGDLGRHAQSIMAGLRRKAASATPRPKRTGPDTLYYRRTTVVHPDGSYEWQVEVLRGMAERVGPFMLRVLPHQHIERMIARRYADQLEQHAYGNDEARERAGTCKCELLSEEAVSLVPTGKVTL